MTTHRISSLTPGSLSAAAARAGITSAASQTVPCSRPGPDPGRQNASGLFFLRRLFRGAGSTQLAHGVLPHASPRPAIPPQTRGPCSLGTLCLAKLPWLLEHHPSPLPSPHYLLASPDETGPDPSCEGLLVPSPRYWDGSERLLSRSRPGTTLASVSTNPTEGPRERGVTVPQPGTGSWKLSFRIFSP